MKKKAVSGDIWMIIVGAAIALFVLVLALYFTGKLGGTQKQLEQLSPNQASICKAKQKLGPVLQLTGGPNDFDDDKWDDSCDWCICKDKGCNNNLIAEGGGDEDGDGLPFLCDANDKPADGGKSILKFNAKNCIPDKTLFEREGMMFCYPKVPAPSK